MKEDVMLYGNGINDDTAAIQAMLDTGRSCVYLPPPEKNYLISKTLRIGSGQELRMDRFTLIRLAPGSDCRMITNRDHEKGNRHIALTGGIWDFDNIHQSPNPGLRHIANPPQPRLTKEEIPDHFIFDFYYGNALYFQNVSDMIVRGITIRNPVTYAIQFCRLSYFVIDDIEFDFTAWNPAKGNMDGIHCDGGCHHGKISNVRGTCFDDMIALNANDGNCAAFQETISDIDIDGVYCDYCHSAVRMLSAGADMRRISIRNVHGNFYRYAIGLTHFFPNNPRGSFDDILIDSCFVAKAIQPDHLWKLWPMAPIFCDENSDVGKLTITNVCREERMEALPLITIGKKSVVQYLTVRDCKQINHVPEACPLLKNDGEIKHIEWNNNVAIEDPDPNWKPVELHYAPDPY